MDHRAFFDDVAKGKIAPCYVFEGTEEYIKRSALAALRKKLLPAGLEDMNEARLTDPDANALIAAAETLPFMADKRLVLVLESGMLSGRAKDYDEAKSAAALVQMLGGTPEQALDASSIALSNLLGLVCDPVGGLVEVPCQNRNAIGVAAAFSSAQLALAGIKSLVPFDQMAHVMLSVGHALPATLRETAKGGIAQAPAALSACARCGACG